MELVPATPPTRTATVAPLLGVVGAGLLSGALGAAVLDSAALRPLAHLIGPWVLLSVAVSARQRPRRAAMRSALGLLAAVVAFYVGRAVAVEGPGHAFALRTGQLALWCVLGVVGGSVLGLLFHRIGRGGPLAAAGAAGALGLLIGDVLNEIDRFGPVLPLQCFTVVAVGTVVLLARPTWRQVLLIAVLTVPATAIGLAVVGLPDDLEKVLLSGF